MDPQPLPPEAYDTSNIFRVQNIPHNVVLAMFPSFFSWPCGLRGTEIHVHSFSRVDAANQESAITATVTFSRKPVFWDTNVCPRAKRLREAIDLRMPDGCNYRPVKVDQQLLGFTPLTPLAIQSAKGRKSIDCIVIHGFGSHPLAAFKARGFSDVWIRDWLPQDFPKLDILTYGYGLHFDDPNASGDIHEWADSFRSDLRAYRSMTRGNANFKPLIFIVHSLGGLVFKDAVVSMANSAIFPGDQKIVKCIHDVFFFAVPSQGMDTEDMEVMAGRLPARITATLLNQNFLHRMRQTLNTQFDQAFPYKDSTIYQFYEALPTKGITKSGQERLLLPQTSTIGRHWENGNDYKMGIEGDHRTLVKFSRTDTSQYQRVKGVLDATMERNPCETIRARFSWGQRNVPLEEKRRDMLKWLATVDPSDIHRRSIDLREEHTCQWIFRWKEWNRWSSLDLPADAKRLLWIWGIPGAGKTILASSVIKRLESLQNTEPLLGVAYYYCTHARATGNDVESFLGWVISQLCHQSGLFVPVDIECGYSRGARLTIKEMLNSLLETCQGFNRVFVIIDGLDESHSRRDFLGCLKSMMSAPGLDNLRVLVASRDEQDIKDALLPIATDVSMSNDVVDEDIGRFIQTQLQVDPVLVKWPAGTLQTVEKKLRKGARGMFRWAACQLEILSTQNHDTETEVLEVLDALPETLDQTYESVLAKIPLQHQKKIRLALCELVDPTYYGMASFILWLVTWEATFNCKQPSSRLFTLDSLKSMCSCLIRISAGAVPRIYLSHYTVKEFLFSTRIQEGPASAYHTTESQAWATPFKAILTTIASSVRSPMEFSTSAAEHIRNCLFVFLPAARRYDNILPLPETEDIDRLLFEILSAGNTIWLRMEEHLKAKDAPIKLNSFPFLLIRGNETLQPAEICARMIALMAPTVAMRYLEALPPNELANAVSAVFQIGEFSDCSLLDVVALYLPPLQIVEQGIITWLLDCGLRPRAEDLAVFLLCNNQELDRDHGSKKVLDTLRRLGITPNPRNVPWTPLQAAMWRGLGELVIHLLNAGANPLAIGDPGLASGDAYRGDWRRVFDIGYSHIPPTKLDKAMREHPGDAVKHNHFALHKWFLEEPGRFDFLVDKGFELSQDAPRDPYNWQWRHAVKPTASRGPQRSQQASLPTPPA
ncbi:hypothetical protein RB601_004359 [Gaeumannomyces tritici]